MSIEIPKLLDFMKIFSANLQLFQKDRRIDVLEIVGVGLHLFFMDAATGRKAIRKTR